MIRTNQRDLQLRFPADNGYLRVCRLTATTLASDLGFDVDALDDIRLAVAEVVNYLVESPTSARIVLRLVADQDGFRLEGRAVGEKDESGRRTAVVDHGDSADETAAVDDSAVDDSAVDDSAVDDSAVDDSAVDDLLHAVLGATTDGYRIGLIDDRRYVWLIKRTSGDSDAEANLSVEASPVGTDDSAE